MNHIKIAIHLRIRLFQYHRTDIIADWLAEYTREKVLHHNFDALSTFKHKDFEHFLSRTIALVGWNACLEGRVTIGKCSKCCHKVTVSKVSLLDVLRTEPK